MMDLNKPERIMNRDLQGIASDLKWSVVDLMRIAERLRLAGNEADAQAVFRMCMIFIAGEDKLNGYADEVKGGMISRLKAE